MRDTCATKVNMLMFERIISHVRLKHAKQSIPAEFFPEHSMRYLKIPFSQDENMSYRVAIIKEKIHVELVFDDIF